MVQHLLQMDLTCKIVLEIGSGTGVLAIFTELKGAVHIDAIDIDNWCYQNALENAERNGCTIMNVLEGDVALLNGRQYDVIIANINRNILLADMKYYISCLENGGELLLSGFYKDDISIIDAMASDYGLKLSGELERNNWVALKYLK